MRHFIAAILAMMTFAMNAQDQQGKNWVFGHNTWMEFSDTGVNMRTAPVDVIECAASISDIDGNLLAYLGSVNLNSLIIYNGLFEPQDTIDNSEVYLANGAMFLPFKDNLTLILTAFPPNSNSSCPSLRVLRYKIVGDDLINYKDIYVDQNTCIYEGLGAIMHANGKDWWVVSHEARDWQDPNDCVNSFVVYLVQEDMVRGPFKEGVSLTDCITTYPAGEVKFSKNGEQFVYTAPLMQTVEVFDFDRCSGNITNGTIIDTSKSRMPISSEFSSDGHVLYTVSDSGLAYSGTYLGQVHQYYIWGGTPSTTWNKIEVWNDTSNAFTLPAIRRGPDDRIYVAYSQSEIPTNTVNYYNTHLSYIEQPNFPGPSCAFRPFALALPDSAYITNNLPNFTSYYLTPYSIYQMDAGSDHVICLDDTTAPHSVQLGYDTSVTDVFTYWINSPIDTADVYSPFITVSPDSSTYYYLMITDTSVTGSCRSRIDTVFVEVTVCTGINEIPLSNISLYPNPATNQLYITLPDNTPTAQLELYSLLGGKLLQTQVHDKTPIDISQLPKGMYVYRLRVGSSIHNGKLLIE